MITVILDGDNCWPDLEGKTIINQRTLDIALLKGGMQSGLDSITVRVDLPGGQVVLIEVSAREFLNCAKAFKARANIGYDIDNPLSGKNPNGPYQPD